jgi:hypothetical protein
VSQVAVRDNIGRGRVVARGAVIGSAGREPRDAPCSGTCG